MTSREYADIRDFFNGGRRAVILATDHRYLGIQGLDQPEKVLPSLLPYADALMTDVSVLGALRRYARKDKQFKGLLDKIPIILRASGSTGTALPAGMPDEFISLHSADVKSYGCDVATVSVYLRPPSDEEVRRYGYEAIAARRRTLENLALLCREAHAIEMLVLGVLAVGEKLESIDMSAPKEVDWFMRTVRTMTAVGANAIKTYYCGEEGTKQVVESATVPVVIAGGKPTKDVDPTVDSIEFALKVRDSGAAGLDVGRRIWRHKEVAKPEIDRKDKAPVAMLRTYREIVHEGLGGGDAAVRRYYSILKEENSKA